MEFNATFIVSAISFIVFVFLMNMIFYAPLEKIITKRDKLVEDTLNEAKGLQDKADSLLTDRNAQLDEAKNKCRHLIKENTENANKDSKSRIQQAKSDSVKKINEKKEQLLKDKETVQNGLESVVDTLANEITAKLLG